MGYLGGTLNSWRGSPVFLLSCVWLLFQVPSVSGGFKEIHIGRALKLNLPTEYPVFSDDACYCKVRCMANPNCLAVSILQIKGGKSFCNFSNTNSPLKESSLDSLAITYTKTETMENSTAEGVRKVSTNSSGSKIFIYSTYQPNITSSTQFPVTVTTNSVTTLEKATTGVSKTTQESTMKETKPSSVTSGNTEPAIETTQQSALNSTMMTFIATSSGMSTETESTTRTQQNSTMMATISSSEKSQELKSTTASSMQDSLNTTMMANISSSETAKEKEKYLTPNQQQINSTTSGSLMFSWAAETITWMPIFPLFNTSSSSTEYESDSTTPTNFVTTYSSELTVATTQNSTQDTCATVIPGQFSNVPEVGTIWIDETEREWTEGERFCKEIESSLYYTKEFSQLSKLLHVLKWCFEIPNLRNYSIIHPWDTDSCWFATPFLTQPLRKLSCDVKGYPICQITVR